MRQVKETFRRKPIFLASADFRFVVWIIGRVCRRPPAPKTVTVTIEAVFKNSPTVECVSDDRKHRRVTVTPQTSLLTAKLRVCTGIRCDERGAYSVDAIFVATTRESLCWKGVEAGLRMMYPKTIYLGHRFVVFSEVIRRAKSCKFNIVANEH